MGMHTWDDWDARDDCLGGGVSRRAEASVCRRMQMLRYALLAAIGEEALVTGLDWTGRRRSLVLSVSSACAPRYLVYCACVFWCLVSVGVDVFPRILCPRRAGYGEGGCLGVVKRGEQ